MKFAIKNPTKTVGFSFYLFLLVQIKKVLITGNVARARRFIFVQNRLLRVLRVARCGSRFQGFVEEIGERAFLFYVRYVKSTVNVAVVRVIYERHVDDMPTVIGRRYHVRAYALFYRILRRIFKFGNEIRLIRGNQVTHIRIQATRVGAIRKHKLVHCRKCRVGIVVFCIEILRTVGAGYQIY